MHKEAQVDRARRRRAAALAAWSAGVAVVGAVAAGRRPARSSLDTLPPPPSPTTVPGPTTAPAVGPELVATGPATTAAPPSVALTPPPRYVPLVPLTGDALVAHVGRRLSGGLTPELFDEIRTVGVDTWLDQQLRPWDIDDSALEQELAALPGLRTDALDFYRLGMLGDKAVADLRYAAVVRAAMTRRQVHEQLVGLWHDRFAVSAGKHPVEVHIPAYDRDSIRPNVLGRFADLLGAVTRSAAMLEYLDNAQSTADSPNENHARELLELHTVGVNGGYTQADVIGASKVLSGWTVQRPDLTVVFDPARHDPSPVTVLGWSSSGRAGADAAGDLDSLLEHLASLPATAQRVAHLLAQRFVADAPPAEVVAGAAEAYLASGGDIGATLRHLFSTDGFRAGIPIVRRPFDLFVAHLRAVRANLADRPSGLQYLFGQRDVVTQQVIWVLSRMSHVPFAPPNPSGYRIPGADWVAASALVQRWLIGEALANGWLQGITYDAAALAGPATTVGAAVDALAARCFGGAPSAATRAGAIVGSLRAEDGPVDVPALQGIVTFLLAAPEMQIR